MISKRKIKRWNERQRKKHGVATEVAANPVLLGNAWNLLVKPWIDEPAAEEPKKKGRPRKHFPEVQGKIAHRMDDNEPTARLLEPNEKAMLTRDFLEYREEKMSLQDSLVTVAKLYEMPRQQAYELLKNEF